MKRLFAASMTLFLATESVGLPAFAQTSTPVLSQEQLQNDCSMLVVNSRLSLKQLPQTSQLSGDGGVPSVEEVSRVIQITQCNWELIKRSAQKKGKGLTGRINTIKFLSTSATVLGAGGTAASASGNKTGLAIGSGAVAVLGIFAGVFGSEATSKRRDMCTQLVTSDHL